MEDMKFCKDCKFEKRVPMSYIPLIGIPFKKYSKCGHPKFTETDLVTGQSAYHSYCSTIRMFNNDCGKQAKYFEPK
jgi:hypothetical protein